MVSCIAWAVVRSKSQNLRIGLVFLSFNPLLAVFSRVRWCDQCADISVRGWGQRGLQWGRKSRGGLQHRLLWHGSCWYSKEVHFLSHTISYWEGIPFSCRCDGVKVCELTSSDLGVSGDSRGTTKYLQTVYTCQPAGQSNFTAFFFFHLASNNRSFAMHVEKTSTAG